MSTRVVTVTTPSFDVAGSPTTKDCNNGETTPSYRPNSSHSYLLCDDPSNHSPFVNPNATAGGSTGGGSFDAKKDRPGGRPQRQRRNWPSRSTTPVWILQSIALADKIFVSWWLMWVLDVWHKHVPLFLKRKLCFWAWGWYVSVHTLVVCGWMGLYSDDRFYRSSPPSPHSDGKGKSGSDFISNEYKAYSTLCYPSQFFVVDVPRMRFALSQLNVISSRDIPCEECVERVADGTNSRGVDQTGTNHRSERPFVVPDAQRDHQTVRGLYVTNPNKRSNDNTLSHTRSILFWFFGGAYLAGDAEGNLSLANEFMEDCNADAVFVPEYRLAPEAKIDDVLWDAAWAYRYLVKRLQKESSQQNQHTDTEIVFVGISSGGAIALRLLQLLRDRSLTTKEGSSLPVTPSFLEPVLDDIVSRTIKSAEPSTSKTKSIRVAGAVLFAPYVDYRDPQPPSGSFVQNSEFDWVVTQAVQHYGLPYLNEFVPPLGDDLLRTNDDHSGYNTNGRIQYSPLTHDMNGLPPLCLIASEHEACYDMAIAIVNKARQGVERGDAAACPPTEVTIGVWKYMCHVFSMMQAFLPEGKASIDFAKGWIQSKTNH